MANRASRSPVERTPAAIQSRTPASVSSLNAREVAERVAEFPFIVSFAYTLDETNWMADYLLPEATDLESLQLIRIGSTTFIEQFWNQQGWATRQRADGLVTMDYDTCIGCGYCAVACPYQARTIAHEHAWYFGTPSRQEEQVFHEERMGVASKCTFCVDKIDAAAKSSDVVPGLDLEATPACAASCIAQALHFGDFADPDSNVSHLAAENAHFQMHAELGTDPQIRYLYEVPATTPGRNADEVDDVGDSHGSDPNDPLVGGRQTFWDVRAAMNFIMGGMSSGLVVAAYLIWAFGGMGDGMLPWFFAAAAASFFLLPPAVVAGTHCLMDADTSWKCTTPLVAVKLALPGAALAVIAASACALAGGALWKFTLVTRACHQQGFALPRLPQRGSGSRAAPARFGLA